MTNNKNNALVYLIIQMIEKFEDGDNSEETDDKSDRKLFRLIAIDFEGILDLDCGQV